MKSQIRLSPAGPCGFCVPAGHAAPDGYTLSIGNWATHVVNGAVYTSRFNLLNDFDPVALISSNPALIVARNTLPPNNLTELIAWLKSNPDTVSAGTSGIGGPGHVFGVLFQHMTGAKFQFVPYRGGGPAMQDLVAGHIDMIVASPSDALPHLATGRIKAYAVTAKTRLASAPEIPTVDEAGLPGLHDSMWYGLFAPKGTPKNVITILNAAVVEALAAPLVRQRLADIENEIPPREEQTPEALRALQKADVEKWWPIIREANIKAG